LLLEDEDEREVGEVEDLGFGVREEEEKRDALRCWVRRFGSEEFGTGGARKPFDKVVESSVDDTIEEGSAENCRVCSFSAFVTKRAKDAIAR
jgi:hypothetical protein